jgi:hypothetical protein
VTLLNGTVTHAVASDPAKADTDGDGLTDLDEYASGTDASSVDTDDDGVLDGSSLAAPDETTRTHWRAIGLVENPPGTFLGELDVCAGTGLRPTEASSDRPLADGLADGAELRGWDVTIRGATRHVTSDPCRPDTDEDSLADDVERALGTDPRLKDTDADHAADGVDADPKWDLGLAFSEFELHTNKSGVIVTFRLGADARAVRPANASANLTLDVDDAGPRDSLVVSLLASAADANRGPVKLFATGDQAVLRFDLVKGTAGESGLVPRLDFAGADGTLAFDWNVTRT